MGVGVAAGAELTGSGVRTTAGVSTGGAEGVSTLGGALSSPWGGVNVGGTV